MREAARTAVATLVACLVATAVCTAIMTTLLVAAVRLRAGRAGLVGTGLSLSAVVVLVVAAVAWNAHDESFPRRYRLETIRAAAGAPESFSKQDGEATAKEPVVVSGFDGMCWSTVTPLMEEGLTPNLAGLIRRGAIGYLDNGDLSLSPQIWTTIFTGRSVPNRPAVGLSAGVRGGVESDPPQVHDNEDGGVVRGSGEGAGP